MKISVVIPVLNEASLICEAIENAWRAGPDEVIVVDGGSNDETIRNCEQAECRLERSEPGRGQQLQQGANVASGDVVLFLHADNRLAPGSCEQIRQYAWKSHRFCGAFLQRIDSPRKIYRWIEKGNELRVRWRGLFYGDQAIFVSRILLEEIGGVPDIPLMEDFVLAQRLRAFERALLPGPVHVSARRWENYGPLRQTIKNWAIVGLFYLGMKPERLAAIYRGKKQ